MNIPVSYVECPFESAWFWAWSLVSGWLVFIKGVITVALSPSNTTHDSSWFWALRLVFIKGVIAVSLARSSWFWAWIIVPVEPHLLEQHPTMPDFVLKQHWTTLDFMLLQQLKIDGLQLCSGPYQNRRYWKVKSKSNDKQNKY